MAARAPRVFADVQKWRAADKHTGIGKDDGIPYTYEHIAEPPGPRASIYRVESYIPFVKPTPLHRDVHYVPGNRLDDFLHGWDEVAAVIVDIRPMTEHEARGELSAFRSRVDGRRQ